MKKITGGLAVLVILTVAFAITLHKLNGPVWIAATFLFGGMFWMLLDLALSYESLEEITESKSRSVKLLEDILKIKNETIQDLISANESLEQVATGGNDHIAHIRDYYNEVLAWSWILMANGHFEQSKTFIERVIPAEWKAIAAAEYKIHPSVPRPRLPGKTYRQ